MLLLTPRSRVLLRWSGVDVVVRGSTFLCFGIVLRSIGRSANAPALVSQIQLGAMLHNPPMTQYFLQAQPHDRVTV
jgi:hypothetical protein